MVNARSRKAELDQLRQKKQQKGGRGYSLKKAKVIAVAGAGGKSTYIRKESERYAKEGRKVAVLTSTHIYNPRYEFGLKKPARMAEEAEGIPDDRTPVASIHGVDYYGVPSEQFKLGSVSRETYIFIIRTYDFVFVEADGSRGMPAKVPSPGEPVIPKETDKIVVVMGKQAAGRTVSEVCQHYDPARVSWLTPDARLSEEDLRRIAREFYCKPLSRTHPDAEFEFYLGDLFQSGKENRPDQVTFALMASGFGRRYSEKEDKLFAPVDGKPLFSCVLENMIEAAKLLREDGIETGIRVVTRYPEIMDFASAKLADYENIRFLENVRAEEGITASIHIGTKVACSEGSGAVIFFAADMPYLDGESIRRFALEFLSSGKSYGCMAYRKEQQVPEDGRTVDKVKVVKSVPGAFRLDNRRDNREALLSLSGDHGAMRVMKAAPWETYLFYVSEGKMRDIDIKE